MIFYGPAFAISEEGWPAVANDHASTNPSTPIVFTIDRGYVAPLKTALTSLALSPRRRTNSLPLRGYILTVPLGSAARREVEAHVDALGLEFELIQLPRKAPAGPISGWISSAAYLRLEAAELLPREARLLYLDADLVVLDDPRPLLEVALGSMLVAAVRDAENPVLTYGIALPVLGELGVPGEREYFNSGVMVVNAERWREERISEQCVTFLRQHPQHVRFWDQDALNFVVADRWKRLDRRWNAFPLTALMRLPGAKYYANEVLPLEELLREERAAGILHFAGPRKPWLPGFPSGEALELYRRYECLASRTR